MKSRTSARREAVELRQFETESRVKRALSVTRASCLTIHAAFTLLELLVSIAIIGILASLLTVAVVEAVKKARGAKCVSNLRQLGIAMTGFVGDTGEYPVYFNAGKYRARNHKKTMEESLDPYLGGKVFEVWRNGCPSASEPTWWEGLNEGVVFEDIGYNVLGIGGGVSDWESEVYGLGTIRQAKKEQEGRVSVPVREGMVVSPSTMIAFGDSFAGEGTNLTDGSLNLSRGELRELGVDERTAERVYSRHQDRMHITFADGHVESLGVEAIFVDTSDDALRRWNRDDEPHRELLEAQN